MVEQDIVDRATLYARHYLDGNRNSVCSEILAGPNPAVMASIVTLELSRIAVVAVAEEFIRILESQIG